MYSNPQRFTHKSALSVKFKYDMYLAWSTAPQCVGTKKTSVYPNRKLINKYQYH